MTSQNKNDMSQVPNIPTAKCQKGCNRTVYDTFSRLCGRCLADYGRTNEAMWDFCGYGVSIEDYMATQTEGES